MLFFSWRCAHTGLPIMAAGLGSPYNNERPHFNPARVTVLQGGGPRVSGLYDGQGQVICDGTGQVMPVKRLVESGDVHLVLTDLCQDLLEGSVNAMLKPNLPEPQMGCMLDEGFVEMMFAAKLAALRGVRGGKDIDGSQYPARVIERSHLLVNAQERLCQHLGVRDASQLQQLELLYLQHQDTSPPALDNTPLAAQVSAMELRGLLAMLPPLMAAEAAVAMSKEVNRVVNAEVIAAWQAGRPAEPISVRDLLDGVGQESFDSRESHSPERPRAAE